MSARRGSMPLVRLQWLAWVMTAIVLAVAVTTALVLIYEQGQ